MITLTTREANLIADVCNGIMILHNPDDPVEKASTLRANVIDACLGQESEFTDYGEKWSVDARALCRKLKEASDEDVATLFDAVAKFWDECAQGKQMDSYYPTTDKEVAP